MELIRRNNPLRLIWANLEAADGLLIFQPPYQTQCRVASTACKQAVYCFVLSTGESIAPVSHITRSLPTSTDTSRPDRMTDGFVTYANAHLDGAVSEVLSLRATCAKRIRRSSRRFVGSCWKMLMKPTGWLGNLQSKSWDSKSADLAREIRLWLTPNSEKTMPSSSLLDTEIAVILLLNNLPARRTTPVSALHAKSKPTPGST